MKSKFSKDFLKPDTIKGKWFLSVIFSLGALIGLFLLGRTDSSDFVALQSMYTLPLIIMLAVFYYFTMGNKVDFFRSPNGKRRLKFTFVCSFFFALAITLGYQMRVNKGITPGVAGVALTVITPFFLQFAFVPFFNLFFAFTDQKWDVNKPRKMSMGKTFLISSGVIFLLWIPTFLAYYPAIMSYDSNRQFSEAWNGVFWELQPLIHTWLIRVFLLLGESLGSFQIGIALMTLMQMLITALVLGYANALVYRMTGSGLLAIVSVLFWGLVPVNSILAVSVTKDILFSAFFVLFICLAIDRQIFSERKKMILFDAGMVLSAALFCMFRKNGIYGLVIFAVIYCFAVKKDVRLRSIIVIAISVLFGILAPLLVKTALNGGDGPKCEAFSVPIQQMAAVAHNHSGELTEEEIYDLEYYIPGSTTQDFFNDSIADGPKSAANTVFDRWEVDNAAWLKTWAHFLVKYPGTYVNAYLGLTEGYWFPDDISSSQVLGYGRDTRMGLIYTFNYTKNESEYTPFEGVESKSLLPAYQYFLEGPASDESYLSWPVLNILFRPSSYVYGLLLIFAAFLYKRRYREMVTPSIELTYFLTVLMGPVANIRYVYQIMLIMPLLFAYFVRCCMRKDS